LSELDFRAQTTYAEKILSHSMRGYVVWNGPGEGDTATDWVSADLALNHLKLLCPNLNIKIKPKLEQFFNIVTEVIEECPNVKTLIW
jgi:hypothetical protein